MRVLPALMMLVGALAVLMTGLAPGGATAQADTPTPCHKTITHHREPQAPAPAPPDEAQAADCCVACVSAPPVHVPVRTRLAPPRPASMPPRADLLAGQRPAPEPHPPRLLPA